MTLADGLSVVRAPLDVVALNSMTTPDQGCVRRVMDTSDPEIECDRDGVCNHCKRAELVLQSRSPAYKKGVYPLDRIVSHMRNRGRGRPSDCALAMAAARLADDPALCRRFGDAALDRCSAQFAPEPIARQMLALYRETVFRSPPPHA